VQVDTSETCWSRKVDNLLGRFFARKITLQKLFLRKHSIPMMTILEEHANTKRSCYIAEVGIFIVLRQIPGPLYEVAIRTPAPYNRLGSVCLSHLPFKMHLVYVRPTLIFAMACE